METDTECLFCQIAAHKVSANFVYEDGAVVAFLSIQPTRPGHTVVVPREHSSRLDLASAQVVANLFEVVRILGSRVRKVMHADGYNIGVNTGLAAGQLIEHTHVHIIPRHTNDGLISWPHTNTTPEDLVRIAADIRAAL